MTRHDFLRHSDAFAWEMEHDAALRSTVVTLLLLDRSPDLARVRDGFERATVLVPMLRRRVVHSAPPAPPRWEDDPDFDLDFHVRRLTATAKDDGEPGLDDLLELARRAEMDDFDRARPLWEATVVEGLTLDGEPGRAALLLKLHHSLTDGVGGVQLAMAILDLGPDPTPREPVAPVPPQRVPGPLTPWTASAAYDAGLLRSLAGGLVRHAPGALRAGLLHPVDTARDVAAMTSSVMRTVRPINQTGSALMAERRLVRHLAVLDVPLADLKNAAHTCDVSLNDAFLAAVTGGLRRYHERHGAEVGDVHVTMPVSLRTDGDAPGGNRITLMRLDMPAGIRRADTRMKAVHGRVQPVRSERSLPYTQAIAGALNLLPRWYLAAMLRHVDVLVSDVPGVPVPLWLGGAQVTMQYPFGPTIGAGVNVTLMSYVDTCAIGVNADSGAVPDLDVFLECLREGFEEVLAVARGR
jgi:diacylglycerol O-acyltransferase